MRTLKPEAATGGTSGSYQYPRRGVGTTIVFKIQYIPGEDDLVTVWLNPDLGPGANEAYQPDALTTRFNARATFDEIRLRHAGKGEGWGFSDLAIATTVSDFVDASSARPSESGADAFGGARTLNFSIVATGTRAAARARSRALTQTHDGYLWLGTDDGLARFDGLRFVTFGLQEGIKTGPVSVLFEDSRNVLWIGNTGGGLNCWQNNRFTAVAGPDGVPTNSVTALADDNTGRLWVGTDAGLALCENHQWQVFAAADIFKGRRVAALLKDRQGTMWVGVMGYRRFSVGEQSVCTPRQPIAGRSGGRIASGFTLFFEDPAGRLWIGAGADFILCRDGSRWHRYRIPRDQAKARSRRWLKNPTGRFGRDRRGRPAAVSGRQICIGAGQ